LSDPVTISNLTHSSGRFWSYPKYISNEGFPDPQEYLVGFIVSNEFHTNQINEANLNCLEVPFKPEAVPHHQKSRTKKQKYFASSTSSASYRRNSSTEQQ